MKPPRSPATLARTLALLCCALAAPLAARATDHALLIGVSDYPALPKRLWLRGPVNDVALMRSTLIQRGMNPAAIQTLASRTGEASEPTRAHILQAMDELKRNAQPGDRVVFYLSGHGSQQPQPAKHGNRPTEPDGLDEVFLPADAAQWDGSRKDIAIPNALLDDEIGEWMDAVVDRGAAVFAVFDTCFAGGMARGGGGHWRAVSRADLGLPASARKAGRQSPPSAPNASPSAAPLNPNRTDGRALAFAARGHEMTGEEWLPKGAALGANRIHGVFTYHLAQALREQPSGLDGGAIEQAVSQAYRQERRSSPTPVFLGEMRRSWP